MARENVNSEINVTFDSSDILSSNLSQLSGSAIASNSGNLSATVLRTCLATNDVNASAINTSTTSIDSKLTTSNTSLSSIDSKLSTSNTNTSSIATNTNNISTDTLVLANSVTASKMQTNTAQIGGIAPSLNSGVLTTGTQRVTIATDDQTAANVNNVTKTLGSSTLYSANSSKGLIVGGVRNDSSTDVFQSNNGGFAPFACGNTGSIFNDTQFLRGQTINLNSGNLDTGTQRICIATNDVNQSAINTATASLNTLITALSKTLGSDTYTEATTKGIILSGVRNDTGASNLASTNNELCPIATNSAGQIQTDFYSVRGSNIAVNSGVNGGGVIRTTLATDDQTATNINNLTKLAGSDTYTEATTKGMLLLGVRNDSSGNTFASTNNELCPISTSSTGRLMVQLQTIGGNTASSNTGTLDAGCLRVAIATDDNVSSKLTTISTTLSTISTTLTSIKTTLDNVYNSTTNWLGTKVVV